MRIKRFFAADIRNAIRQVREEQGPDAVILSNREVDGGVEIVAAVDYDEELVNGLAVSAGGNDSRDQSRTGEPRHREGPTRVDAPSGSNVSPRDGPPPQPKIVWSQEPALVEMRRELRAVRGLLEHQLSGFAWGDLARRHPLRTRLLRVLLQSGFSTGLCEQVAETIPEHLDFAKARRLALGALAHGLPVTGDDILQTGGTIALLGSTGVGKTTTVAKLAARFALRHGARHVALLTTDNYRVGAHEQLRAFAQLMEMPLRAVRNREELAATLKSLEAKRLVLIDTAGMSQRDLRLAEQFAVIRGSAAQVKSYLVLGANTQMEAMAETVAAFQGAELKGCILTKIDEASTLGPALSVLIQRRLPAAYVSDGQRVPEDLHPARAHGLISRSMALSGQARARRQQKAEGDGDAGAGLSGHGSPGASEQRRILEAVAMALAFGGSSTDAHA